MCSVPLYCQLQLCMYYVCTTHSFPFNAKATNICTYCYCNCIHAIHMHVVIACGKVLVPQGEVLPCTYKFCHGWYVACCWCHRELQEDPFWLACNDCGKTELLQKPGNFRTLNFFTCRTKLSSIISKPAAVRNKSYHFRSELLHIMRTYSAMICSHWRPVAFWNIASSPGPLEAGDWCRLICCVSITDWLQYVDLMLVTMNSVPLIMKFTGWSQSL